MRLWMSQSLQISSLIPFSFPTVHRGFMPTRSMLTHDNPSPGEHISAVAQGAAWHSGPHEGPEPAHHPGREPRGRATPQHRGRHCQRAHNHQGLGQPHLSYVARNHSFGMPSRSHIGCRLVSGIPCIFRTSLSGVLVHTSRCSIALLIGPLIKAVAVRRTSCKKAIAYILMPCRGD